MEDINSGKINNRESATDRYIKDIFPDKKFLKTKKITDGTPSHTLKKVFDDFEYTLFGVFDPSPEKSDTLDMPPLETEVKKMLQKDNKKVKD